ncbi:MAG: 30S ribosomal protein S5 [Victivallales bacterium]|jgi:small subunit ribosomal protein S5|nr:30S ribosomal protein S5 [Victivallales bacterium]MBR4369968.1 30S ribosomal protein S5 [Victivallales bacterium]MBR4417610.1 30S ribosomal protein S5 [Victivallales bacterium]MBR5078702.1 30S ribosomal protein S5 [Victivallales bacterium]MBR5836947.1 30S ribosomal protein S5 [Victivallales bacterium]
MVGKLTHRNQEILPVADQLNKPENEEAPVNTRDFVGAVAQDQEYEERVVAVNRSSKVVKGGRNFSFSALVVVGDKKGKVGMGFGKANEVADAIRKGGEQARKNIVTVPMFGTSITHFVAADFRGASVIVRPASAGTGVIAGGGMRHVLELGGVKDVLAKSLGSKNAVNVVKATFAAIAKLRTRSEMLAKRDRNTL